MLDKIALGKQGLQVTKLGFGCMGLTSFYGDKLPDEDVTGLLVKVYRNGINFWDTANVYIYPEFKRLLQFQSPIVCQEEIIRRAVEQVGRDNLVLATKTGLDLRILPMPTAVPDGSPAFIRKQCEASLKRLDVSCIDLFYLHRIDQKIPIEVSMMEMKKLVEEGKIKYVGLSECSPSTLRRAHAIHPVSVVQMEYSLWCRGIEKELLPVCKELGVGLVAYSPLGRGFFGGAHKQKLSSTDFRKGQERFNKDKNHQMYEALEEFAKKKEATAAQLALAWVEAQQDRLGGAGVVAIPGTTKEKNLLSNIESTRVSLTKEDLEEMEKIVPWEEVEGGRYEAGFADKTWEADANPPLTDAEKAKWKLSM